MSSAPLRRRLTVGLTIPVGLALVVLAEVLLRAVPLDRFAFRSLEALAAPDRSGGPFVPSRKYENSRTYGDLAGMGNLRSHRQYRKEVFTTDRWGYRNDERNFREPPGAIVIGDSFGIAPGVVDSETLPAQLGRLWGRGVYNASGMFRMNDVDQIRTLARRLGMRDGFVIHAFLERQDLPAIRPPSRGAASAAPAAPEVEPVSRRIISTARRWWSTCRLRILTERVYRLAQNDRLLPNHHRVNVAVERLVNGEEILFLPGDVGSWKTRRPVRADFWRWMRDELGRDRLRLVVLLVPNKYTVYAPLLAPPVTDAQAGADHLDRLEKVLREAGIDVVNLKGVYRSQARRDLARGIYLYFRDDSHWTGHGMKIAAERLHGSGVLAAGRRSSAQPGSLKYVRLADGKIYSAELHWYEAHGIGRREMKVKKVLE